MNEFHEFSHTSEETVNRVISLTGLSLCLQFDSVNTFLVNKTILSHPQHVCLEGSSLKRFDGFLHVESVLTQLQEVTSRWNRKMCYFNNLFFTFGYFSLNNVSPHDSSRSSRPREV